MNDAMQLTPHNSMGRTFFSPPPHPQYTIRDPGRPENMTTNIYGVE